MSLVINALKTPEHAGSPKLICGGKLKGVVAPTVMHEQEFSCEPKTIM